MSDSLIKDHGSNVRESNITLNPGMKVWFPKQIITRNEIDKTVSRIDYIISNNDYKTLNNNYVDYINYQYYGIKLKYQLIFKFCKIYFDNSIHNLPRYKLVNKFIKI